MENAKLLGHRGFAAFRPLLNEMLPVDALFAVSAADGRLYCADDGFPAEVPAKALHAMPDKMKAVGENKTSVRRISLAPRVLYMAPMYIESEAGVAYFWALLSADHNIQRVEAALSAIAGVIARDLDSNAELNKLATELSNRYEELNLVYHTEDQVNYFAEGQEALNKVLKNCCDFLNVDVAAIHLREKGIRLSVESPNQSAVALDVAVETLLPAAYESVIASAKEIVFRGSDLAADSACSDCANYSIAGAPVFDAKSAVIGILMLVNGASKLRFANSDKNLLRVMARTASKIIQLGYDQGTGLINREGYEYYVEKQFADFAMNDSIHCLMHVNIDRLQVTNDTVSYEAGNAVINATGEALCRSVRDSDVVARVGGNEFGIVLRNCSIDQAVKISEKLRASLVGAVIPWEGRSLNTTVSIGVAPIDSDTESAAASMAAAELACDAAKALGKNRVHAYSHQDTGLIKRHEEMESVGRIQAALEDDRFELFAQLIEPVAGPGERFHIEVLLRMRDDDDSILSPAAFLPGAERYHLMPQIDRWVVNRTLAFINAHAEQLTSTLQLISINLSGQALNEPGFVDFLKSELASVAIPLDRICFEITETSAVEDLGRARAFMDDIKTRGCRFALDDFGSGLSSFRYLSSLPVDYLKIDGDIVRHIDTDPVSASMVAAVQQVASVMQLQTIAEFVESDAIRQHLLRLGVGFAQGYGIGKPKPLAEFLIESVESREAVGR